jgi:hypothetical protein
MINAANELVSQLKLSVQAQYVSLVVNSRPADRNKNKLTLHQQDAFIRLVSSVSTSERLAESILNVFEQLADSEWVPAKLAEAFDGLETYALNLLDFPWKKEFRVILVSCKNRCLLN